MSKYIPEDFIMELDQNLYLTVKNSFPEIMHNELSLFIYLIAKELDDSKYSVSLLKNIYDTEYLKSFEFLNSKSDNLLYKLSSLLNIQYPVNYNTDRLKYIIDNYMEIRRYKGSDLSVLAILSLIGSNSNDTISKIECKVSAVLDTGTTENSYTSEFSIKTNEQGSLDYLPDAKYYTVSLSSDDSLTEITDTPLPLSEPFRTSTLIMRSNKLYITIYSDSNRENILCISKLNRYVDKQEGEPDEYLPYMTGSFPEDIILVKKNYKHNSGKINTIRYIIYKKLFIITEDNHDLTNSGDKYKSTTYSEYGKILVGKMAAAGTKYVILDSESMISQYEIDNNLTPYIEEG